MMTLTEKRTENKLVFRLWKGPMPVMLMDSLERCIRKMFMEGHIADFSSEDKFFKSTWDLVVAASLTGTNELWMAIDGHTVRGYGLCYGNKQIDGEPTFVIQQAWADPVYRRTPEVKRWLKVVLDNAKCNFFRHVLIISSRNQRAYLRWLGNGWTSHTSIIKGEL